MVMKTMIEPFFITGTLRSGTTLLDKVLYAHPQATTLSQPASALYLFCKKYFLENLGVPVSYMVLSHYFQEKNYTPADFYYFLQTFAISEKLLAQINTENARLSANNPFFSKIAPLHLDSDNSFIACYRRIISENSNKKDAIASGCKEVLAEEYLPYFLDNGIKCLLIIRDPRDTLASSYYGSARTYTGSPKPLLLLLRNWRKSVAFALELSAHKSLLVLRYEDLVLQTVPTLDKITKFLGLPQLPQEYIAQLQKQDGGNWSGNSSFGARDGISSKSIGSFRKQLTPDLQHYIESTCFPEMKTFSYQTDLSCPDLDLISSFEEPFTDAPQGTENQLSKNSKESEIERLRLLNQNTADLQRQKEFFIFEQVYSRLRQESLICH